MVSSGTVHFQCLRDGLARWPGSARVIDLRHGMEFKLETFAVLQSFAMVMLKMLPAFAREMALNVQYTLMNIPYSRDQHGSTSIC